MVRVCEISERKGEREKERERGREREGERGGEKWREREREREQENGGGEQCRGVRNGSESKRIIESLTFI